MNSVQTNKLCIDTQVTTDKVALAEQEHLAVCIQNGLRLSDRSIEQEKSIWHQLLRGLVVTASVFCISLILYSWIYPDEVCGTVDYIEDTLYLLFSLALIVFLIKEKYLAKIVSQKWIPFICNKTASRAFKNLKEDYLPLVASYEFDENQIVYKRKVNDSEKFVWKKPVNKDCRYFTTDNLVFIYLKKAFYPAYLIFIDETNVDLVISHLNSIGIKRLPLPPLMPSL